MVFLRLFDPRRMNHSPENVQTMNGVENWTSLQFRNCYYESGIEISWIINETPRLSSSEKGEVTKLNKFTLIARPSGGTERVRRKSRPSWIRNESFNWAGAKGKEM